MYATFKSNQSRSNGHFLKTFVFGNLYFRSSFTDLLPFIGLILGLF